MDIPRECCERFIFVQHGRLTQAASFQQLLGNEHVRAYLGRLAPK